jgi:RNA polymerase sigma factor for flagellar operon FliA
MTKRTRGREGPTTRARGPVTDGENGSDDISAAATEGSVVAVLWKEFKTSGSPSARERLILNYSPLVKYVAGRVSVGLPQNIEQADLVSYGIFGLIDAIEKFDPGRDIKFETYAISRIRGAIIDELRAIDWIPRSVRSKAREVERPAPSADGR